MGNKPSYTKGEIKELAGDLFKEELWAKYASHEGKTIQKENLFILKNTYGFKEKMTIQREFWTDETSTKQIADEGQNMIDCKLLSLEKEEMTLSSLYDTMEKPLVLNIGSCT